MAEDHEIRLKRDVDAAPGGLATWHTTLGGSVIWRRFNRFTLIGIFVLPGGITVALAPIP